jgi:hypothetical protein
MYIYSGPKYHALKSNDGKDTRVKTPYKTNLVKQTMVVLVLPQIFVDEVVCDISIAHNYLIVCIIIFSIVTRRWHGGLIIIYLSNLPDWHRNCNLG